MSNTHRFSRVRRADSIVVLCGASVIEGETADELMASGGSYCERYGIQASAHR